VQIPAAIARRNTAGFCLVAKNESFEGSVASVAATGERLHTFLAAVERAS